MPTYYAFDTLHTLTMATTATFKSKKRMVVAHHPIQLSFCAIVLIQNAIPTKKRYPYKKADSMNVFIS